MNIDSQLNGKNLILGTLKVCGLKKRLDYPEILTTVFSYDILCIAETKLDNTDVISVLGIPTPEAKSIPEIRRYWYFILR